MIGDQNEAEGFSDKYLSLQTAIWNLTAELRELPEFFNQLIENKRERWEVKKAALRQISMVANTFFDELTPSQFMTGLYLLSMFYTVPPPTHGDIICDIQQIKIYKRMMKFATAAYGWKGILSLATYDGEVSTLGMGLLKFQGNHAALQQHCRVNEGDIIDLSIQTVNVYLPGHYVVIDRKSRSIVIAIRGTFHLNDVLTDLVASYSPFLEGQAHSGMANAAERVVDKFIGIIEKNLPLYPGYGVKIVGHSLGAGTAALLTILIKKKLPHLPIHAYCFAPPPVLSENLVPDTESYITSIVHGADIVCRLSLGSLADLKELIKRVKNHKNESILTTLFDQLSHKIIPTNISSLLCELKENSISLGPLNLEDRKERLCLAGKVIYMENIKGNYILYETHRRNFGDIILNADMLDHHYPGVYQQGLNSIINKIKGKHVPTNRVGRRDVLVAGGMLLAWYIIYRCSRHT